jgi:hypothetical protein
MEFVDIAGIVKGASEGAGILSVMDYFFLQLCKYRNYIFSLK